MTRPATLDEINAELAAVADRMRAIWAEFIEPDFLVIESMPEGVIKGLLRDLGSQMVEIDDVLARRLDVAHMRQYGASFEEISERLGWPDSVLCHARDCIGEVYDNEAVITTQSGRELRFPVYPGDLDYVRVVEYGFELAYWSSDEWAESPQEVMGAILGCAMNGVAAQDQDDLSAHLVTDRPDRPRG